MKRTAAFIIALILIISTFSFITSAIDYEITPTVLDFTMTTKINQEYCHENTDMRATGLILSYGLELRKSGTTLTILGVTDCSLDVVKCGYKNLTIQRRKTSSDSWSDYYEYGNVYAEATAAHLNTTLSVASGYQYRISCKHYAKKSLLLTQSISNTSNIVIV